MQFKNPEVFYFLILLLIPIIVHLFQLQKFKKIAFTNVSFLKKISLETRKSSRLKKWLILTTRLIGLLALLFTFSQPYLSNKKAEEKNHNLIYLDNSISLNTNGNQGDLLKIAAQKIIENSSENDEYTLLTNDNSYEKITKKELSDILKNVQSTSNQANLSQKIVEIESKIKNKSISLYKNILISDFQNINKNINNEFTNVKTPFNLIKLKPNQENNISIDSVSITNSNAEEISLSVFVKNQGTEKKEIPIALYNDDKLINKRSFSIDKDQTKKISFSISKATDFKGKIQVTYNDIFLFDNVFFFTINTRKKINVLSLGKPANYLSKIFTSDAFNYQSFTNQNINYNKIAEQQLIILNELQTIPNVLKSTLLKYIQNGGHLLVIPDKELNIASYNSFFRSFTTGSISNKRQDSLKITDINFDHPLYTNVFSKKVANFQFPVTSVSFESIFRGSTVISYENKASFLQEINNPYTKIYWFSSPLSLKVTNFSNSPLIVPTLYNIGQQSLEVAKPYYILNRENNIDVSKKLSKDEVVTISNNDEDFIPLQQSYSNKVRLTTEEQPHKAGFYFINLKTDTLETLAYNVPKTESLLTFYDIQQFQNVNKNFKIYDSVEDFFTEINQKNEVQWLWKLFLAIAIVSLLLEILILKFFRT